MRILVSSVTRQDPVVLEAHLKSLKQQELPDHVKLDFFYILDPDISTESIIVLDNYKIPADRADPKPVEAEYEVSDETHHWNKPTFYWLGKQKQKLLEKGKEYDAVFLVDSDLILDSGTLKSLLSADKPIVSGVFWTKWTPNFPSLPQVWMEHPYEMQGRGLEAHEHLQKAATRQLWRVAGLGACTLIKSEVLDQVQYYPILPGLPEDGMWQGEDRTFCITAQQNHVEMWADGWPNIYHAYRPKDAKNLESVVKNLEESRITEPSYGDYVSLKLSPVEEPQLAGWSMHYRGKIGSESLASVLSREVHKMHVGDDKFVQLRFPVWWPLSEYAGKLKTVRVQLLDAKLDNPHPETEEAQDFDIYYES